MFLFIYRCNIFNKIFRVIQIHLMFLFIIYRSKYNYLAIQFKYISCSYLSDNRTPASLGGFNSNTSHVLIYQLLKWNTTPLKINSNTSHVLIYPFQCDCRFFYSGFKYISCSYLS